MSNQTIGGIFELDGVASAPQTQSHASVTDYGQSAEDGLGYSGYASSITTLSSVLSGHAATSAFKTKLTSKRDADIANTKSLVGSYELSHQKSVEAINSINSAMGDKLSERGLKAMKETALLKVAAAETGTSGGTTDFAIEEAFLNENFDQANIVAANNAQVKNVMMGMELEENKVRNKIDNALLGGGVSIDTNSFLTALQGGLNVGVSTLGLLTDREKVNAFDIKPV